MAKTKDALKILERVTGRSTKIQTGTANARTNLEVAQMIYTCGWRPVYRKANWRNWLDRGSRSSRGWKTQTTDPPFGCCSELAMRWVNGWN